MSDITNQPLLFFLPLLNLKFLLNAVLQAAIINYLELAHEIEGHPRTKLDLITVWTGVEKGQTQGGTQVSVTVLLGLLLSGKAGGTQSCAVPDLTSGVGWGPSLGHRTVLCSVLRVSGAGHTPGPE